MYEADGKATGSLIHFSARANVQELKWLALPHYDVELFFLCSSSPVAGMPSMVCFTSPAPRFAVAADRDAPLSSYGVGKARSQLRVQLSEVVGIL